MENLKDKIKNAAAGPGVYQFIGRNGQPLYVGRAVNLKRRLLSYFSSAASSDDAANGRHPMTPLSPRIKEMVGLAKEIKVKKTDNLLEAIILEANLIKKHWPKYNIREKDNRSFVYLVIPKSDYPAPMIVRQRELEKFPSDAKIFGPFQSYRILKDALKIVRRIFPYSVCRPNSGKPCFNYQIGLCPGVCVGEISKRDYRKIIRNIVLLFSGQKKRLLNKLAKENPDKIKALRQIQDVALIAQEETGAASKINRIEGYDISHLTGQETYGAMAVFAGGQPDNSQYRLFKIKSAPKNDDLRALQEIISRRLAHREWPWPDLILIDGGRPQVDFVWRTLQKLQVNVSLIGISKYQGDQLVFPPKTKKSVKDLAAGIKKTLQAVRDEAHRFGRRASRQKRRLRVK